MIKYDQYSLSLAKMSLGSPRISARSALVTCAVGRYVSKARPSIYIVYYVYSRHRTIILYQLIPYKKQHRSNNIGTYYVRHTNILVFYTTEICCNKLSSASPNLWERARVGPSRIPCKMYRRGYIIIYKTAEFPNGLIIICLPHVE